MGLSGIDDGQRDLAKGREVGGTDGRTVWLLACLAAILLEAGWDKPRIHH